VNKLAEEKARELRGCSDLVYAKITSDTVSELVYSDVKPLAPLASVVTATESSSESHFYDNQPKIVISSEGAEEVTLGVAAIPLAVLADITGKFYDESLGMFVDQEATPADFALGYKYNDTNGDTVYVWHLKGKFAIPERTVNTKDDGTEATGQELSFLGVNTEHKFVKTGKSAKHVQVESGKGLADVSQWFETVQTPDTVKVVSA
jgi:phi13 family phage major tail protein